MAVNWKCKHCGELHGSKDEAHGCCPEKRAADEAKKKTEEQAGAAK